MAKNKTENRPIRMDDETWVKLKELAENRRPQETRPSMINRLIWEEAERVKARLTQSVAVPSAQSAALDADPSPEPDLEWED